MRRRSSNSAVPALDLVEEAVHLLRLSPVPVLLSYYLGSAPFILAFLFFWSDMSRSAFAIERCAPLAAVVTLSFIWMKACHVLFARMLRERLIGRALEPLTKSEWIGRVASQTFVQGTGLFVLPLALVLTIPAGWCIAFYQNSIVLAGLSRSGRDGDLRAVVTQSRLWAAQNHIALVVLFGFGVVVFINIITTMFAAPYLLKTLLGVETAASRSWWTMLNTTFVMIAFALTWLCVDPIVKAVYVLRCFYGQSLSDGADLRAELRSSRLKRSTMAAAAVLVILCAGARPLCAQDDAGGSVPSEAASIAPNQLDEAIDNTLQKREFAWRLPRETDAPPPSSDNWLTRNIDRSLEWVGAKLKALFRSVFDFIRWIVDKLFDTDRPTGASGTGWMNAVRGLFVLAICALAAGLAYLLWRLWKSQRDRAVIPAEVAAAVPDLEEEDLSAAALPENEWLSLAREMLERGEYRLALRAFYLAGLAHLAERGLLTIERYKSNHEYRRELDRRAHALPETVEAFENNVRVFDRVWYGRHHADARVIEEFEGNLKRICGT